MTLAERDLGSDTNRVGADLKTLPSKWSVGDPEYLLQTEGFNVEFIGLTASDNVRCEKNTILAVMTNHSSRLTSKISGLKTPTNFRVVALWAYNEEDIIVRSIKKWTDQGVEVHVLENWSTDATYDLAKQLEGQVPVTIERFPAEGPSG